MSWTTLLLDQREDGIAIVTLNRPEKLNALNAEVLRELDDLTSTVLKSDSVRGVILIGAGPKAFVAGADISEIAQMDGNKGADFAHQGQRVFRNLELLPKPVIAAVNGFALGGGCELAMSCHIRLAAPNAKFGQPEVKLGLIPGYGGTVRLPRLVGRSQALELLLAGGMIDAETALRIGLVNRIVPAESLLDEAIKLLQTILVQGPLAVRLCIETVDRGLDLSFDDAMELEAKNFGIAAASADRREGATAFLEKRAATFTGR